MRLIVGPFNLKPPVKSSQLIAAIMAPLMPPSACCYHCDFQFRHKTIKQSSRQPLIDSAEGIDCRAKGVKRVYSPVLQLGNIIGIPPESSRTLAFWHSSGVTLSTPDPPRHSAPLHWRGAGSHWDTSGFIHLHRDFVCRLVNECVHREKVCERITAEALWTAPAPPSCKMAGVHSLVTSDWMAPVSIRAAGLNWMIGPSPNLSPFPHPPSSSSWLQLSLSFHAGAQEGCRSESTTADIAWSVLPRNTERRCSASSALWQSPQAGPGLHTFT